jgi:hypothetical protein
MAQFLRYLTTIPVELGFLWHFGPSQKKSIVLFYLLTGFTVSIKRAGLDIWKKSLLI